MKLQMKSRLLLACPRAKPCIRAAAMQNESEARKIEESSGNVVYCAPRMLETKRNSRWGRSLVAVCLTLLFSLSSLASLAARSINEASAAMRCCPTTDKSCCRKSHRANPNDGPSVGAAGCVDCGGGILASASSMGYAAIHFQLLMPAIRSAGRAFVSNICSQSRTSTHGLRQRPPPQNLLV